MYTAGVGSSSGDVNSKPAAVFERALPVWLLSTENPHARSPNHNFPLLSGVMIDELRSICGHLFHGKRLKRNRRLFESPEPGPSRADAELAVLFGRKMCGSGYYDTGPFVRRTIIGAGRISHDTCMISAPEHLAFR
jgi:hypothetical protein